jgi:hypothetical protein
MFHVVTRLLVLSASDEPGEAVEDERSRDRDVQAGAGADHGNLHRSREGITLSDGAYQGERPPSRCTAAWIPSKDIQAARERVICAWAETSPLRPSP